MFTLIADRQIYIYDNISPNSS